MICRKNDSIRVSERVFDILDQQLNDIDKGEVCLGGYLSTFNNCREQGYYLTAYDSHDFGKGDTYVWVAECRGSDDIMVVMSRDDDYPTNKGMFSEAAYENAKYFNSDKEHEAAEYIVNQLRTIYNF